MAIFAEESLEMRRKLAYACRILAANGQNDAVFGHVSYRQAGETTYWMKPGGFGLEEITPETLILLDLDGHILAGTHSRHIEYPIHSEVFRVRPEITCVIHTHPIYSIAFAATGQPLQALSQEGPWFTPPDVPRFTKTSNLIATHELGVAVADTLGSARACYLVNHGIIVAGISIEEAVHAALCLERASHIQLLASAASPHVRSTPEEESLEKRGMFSPQALKNLWDYYCRGIGQL